MRRLYGGVLVLAGVLCACYVVFESAEKTQATCTPTSDVHAFCRSGRRIVKRHARVGANVIRALYVERTKVHDTTDAGADVTITCVFTWGVLRRCRVDRAS